MKESPPTIELDPSTMTGTGLSGMPPPAVVTIKVVKKQKSDKLPSKSTLSEELNRLADLALTISKRIRQLEAQIK